MATLHLSCCSALFMLCAVGYLAYASGVANFNRDVYVYYGMGKPRVLGATGNVMTLSLDRSSGSGFKSKYRYMYGRIDMQIKLVGGNSAGTVTCFYLHSQDAGWDEIDFEFLGNVSGQPYKVHTNVYTNGIGNREQQFFLWFDPTAALHTYTILWNPHHIVWYVDGKALREYKNLQSMGIPFPTKKPMYMMSSLWDAEDWATRGGLEKTDWSKAPFVATFANFNPNACTVGASGIKSCGVGARQWFSQQLDVTAQQQMRWLRSKYMIYNYCTDRIRFPQGFPKECALMG